MFKRAGAQDLTIEEKKNVDLFFGALFRLGVWTGDWETWYGTRPLAPWIRETQQASLSNHDIPSQRPVR